MSGNLQAGFNGLLRQSINNVRWDDVFGGLFGPKRDFGRAANDDYDEYETRLKHGSLELWDHVTGRDGKVDVYTALRFVESIAKGDFKKNPAITDARAQQGLKAVGFETVVNLFDALSTRPIEGISVYLDLLNRSMGLDEAYYRKRAENVKAFFQPANTAFLESRWDEAKRAGKIPASEKSFTDAMADAFSDPQIVTQGDFRRRKALMQFISDAYSAYVGEPQIKVMLISERPELGGYHGKDKRTGENVIGLNVNNFAFQTNFQSALNTLMHERHHGSQQFLVDRYKEGKIKRGDADYVAARVATANMGPYGYIRPDYMAGPLAYRDQPIEAEANNAGKMAEYYAHTTYARPPSPVISVRDSHRDKAETKGYENLLDRLPDDGRPQNPRRPGGRGGWGNGLTPG